MWEGDAGTGRICQSPAPPQPRRPPAHVVKDVHHGRRVGAEHAVEAHGISVGERAFVEQAGVHRAVRGQVLDDHVDELDLVGRQRPSRHEAGERPHRRLAVHADQRTDKEAEAAVRLRRLKLGRRCPGLDEKPLQFGDVHGRQRLVSPQLDDGDVIFVGLEEVAHLGAEARHVAGRTQAIDVDRRRRPEIVLEIGVDRRPAPYFDQLDEVAQPAAHRLEHRHGDVLPVEVGLDLLDQFQFPLDHRHVGNLFQQAGDVADLGAQAVERVVRAQQRKLRPKNEKVEFLGGKIVVHDARRQPGHFVAQFRLTRSGRNALNAFTACLASATRSARNSTAAPSWRASAGRRARSRCGSCRRRSP
jgi:hypothetical protein